MIKLTFKRFVDGKYKNGPWCIYVLRTRSNVLYVGKSETGVWNRWFGGLNSHMCQTHGGHWYGNSSAGRAVVEHWPASLKWIIELWTSEDCIALMGGKYDGWNKLMIPVSYLENDMIRLLNPSLNTNL